MGPNSKLTTVKNTLFTANLSATVASQIRCSSARIRIGFGAKAKSEIFTRPLTRVTQPGLNTSTSSPAWLPQSLPLYLLPIYLCTKRNQQPCGSKSHYNRTRWPVSIPIFTYTYTFTFTYRYEYLLLSYRPSSPYNNVV